MTFNIKGFQTLHAMGSPSGTAGSRNALHSYVTNDLPSVVETADYFLSIYKNLKVGDLILTVLDIDATSPQRPVNRNYVVTASSSTTVTIDREDADSGEATRAVVPTAAGLTTGLIYDTDSFVVATSANANHILKLPACSEATRGREFLIWVVPSTNCELQTTGTGDTINDVDCSGGAVEALLTHTQFYRVTQHLATGYLLQAFTALGAVATPIVPD